MKILWIAVTTMTLVYAGSAIGDEAPIAGTIKAVDLAAKTITVDAPAHRQSRVVVIDIKPGSRIVRFVRSADGVARGFVEQPVAIEELKPGWTLSVTTKHDRDREVAEVVKVLVER